MTHIDNEACDDCCTHKQCYKWQIEVDVEKLMSVLSIIFIKNLLWFLNYVFTDKIATIRKIADKIPVKEGMSNVNHKSQCVLYSSFLIK